MKQYSIDDIKRLWTTYKTSLCYSYHVAGAWTHVPLIGGRTIPKDVKGLIAASTKSISEVMSFVEFLEKYADG